MTILLIIVAAAWIVYKTKIMRWFLMKCQFDGPPVAFRSETKRAARIKSRGPLIMDTAPQDIKNAQKYRAQLEIQAAYIVGQQGHNPASVKYMSVALMEALIRDYIKATKE